MMKTKKRAILPNPVAGGEEEGLPEVVKTATEAAAEGEAASPKRLLYPFSTEKGGLGGWKGV